jgi:hypothetical protein
VRMWRRCFSPGEPRLQIHPVLDMFAVNFDEKVLPFPPERIVAQNPIGRIYFTAIENKSDVSAQNCQANVGFIHGRDIQLGAGLWLGEELEAEPTPAYTELIPPRSRLGLACFAVARGIIWYHERERGPHWHALYAPGVFDPESFSLVIGITPANASVTSVRDFAVRIAGDLGGKPKTSAGRRPPTAVPKGTFRDYCDALASDSPGSH